MQNEPIGGRWSRLTRSARVLLNANRVDNTHGERFHQFVRSLDGLTKTRVARGEADFVYQSRPLPLRVQKLTSSCVRCIVFEAQLNM